MDIFIPAAPISPLRQRLIDAMTMREFSRDTQRNYIRDVGMPRHPSPARKPCSPICRATRTGSRSRTGA